MNINRDNYESLFLLYLDNELPASDKLSVEQFLTENTDLVDEFNQLKSAILPGEFICFDDKPGLLKAAENNVEESLLSLLDGELNENLSTGLKQLIVENATVAAEWQLLQQTKLDSSETVVFPGKQMLYRKETGKVAAGRFLRLAIAAAFIGIGIFSITKLAVPSKSMNEIEPAVAKVKNDIQPVRQQQVTVAPSKQLAVNKNQPVNEAQDESMPGKVELLAAAGKNKKTEKNLKISPDGNTGIVKPGLSIKQTGQNLAYKVTDNKPLTQNETTAIALMSPKQKLPLTDVNVLETRESSYASTASLTNEANENKVLFLNEDVVTHSRAAGFLRKLKRTVERKTKINTGNNLKIAGFEIALN